MTPHSGKAIGLQLDQNLKLISFSFAHTVLKRLHTGQDPEQVLTIRNRPQQGRDAMRRSMISLTPLNTKPSSK
jgi:hypothetical protein